MGSKKKTFHVCNKPKTHFMYAICVCFSLCFHGGFRRFYATRLSAGKFWMFLPRPTWIQWGFFVGQIQKCLSFCLSINLQVGYDFVIFCICTHGFYIVTGTCGKSIDTCRKRLNLPNLSSLGNKNMVLNLQRKNRTTSG